MVAVIGERDVASRSKRQRPSERRTPLPWMRHLYEKYFSYRRRYVDYILKEAPQRAVLAVVSEIARLAFVGAGAGLCAFIFGALLAGLPAGTGWRWLTFVGALGLAALLAALLGMLGAIVALRDLGRVQEQLRR